MAGDIPLIDLAVLSAGGSVDALSAELLEVYGTIGFGYVMNHGIADELVSAVFEASRRFHALPREAKMAIELNRLHRGFIPIDTSTDVTSTLAEVTKPNQSESFMMMREATADDPDVVSGAYLAGPNQWPDQLLGFRSTLEEYHEAMCGLSGRLVEVLGRALGDEAGTVERSFVRPTTWLRLLHYPAQHPQTPDDLYGSAPHTDFGCLTILAQDEVGGLEVRTPDGGWVAAPYIPGTFVVNVGQMLHRWSNGRLLATPHRVINRSGRERYSVPFFYDPNVATVIEPLPNCVAASPPCRFEPVVFGDFLRSELEAGYDRHRPTDDGS